MTRVVVTETARRDIDRLIIARSLPDSTPERIRAILTPLRTYPLLGRELVGRWAGRRVLIGPWPWMLLVYSHDASTNVVALLTVQDSRMANAATSSV